VTQPLFGVTKWMIPYGGKQDFWRKQVSCYVAKGSR
jgi:hypothetical protein